MCGFHLSTAAQCAAQIFDSRNQLDNFLILLQITEEPDQVQGNGPRFSASAKERLDLEAVLCLGGTHWT